MGWGLNLKGYGRLSVKTSIFSLRRLRWKLTLSYTLVTILTLLAVELVLVGILAAFLNSGLPSRLAAREMRDSLAPSLEKPLAQSPPNTEAIRDELTNFVDFSYAEGSSDNMPRSQDPTSFQFGPNEGGLFVVNRDRRLLVSVPEIDQFPEGEAFEAVSLAGLPTLLDQALSGTENTQRLSTNADGRLLAALPLKNGQGNVVGVLVGIYRMPDLTTPLLIAVGVSTILLLVPAVFIGTIFGLVTALGLTRRIGRLARAAQSWSQGDFSEEVKDRSKDELGQLTRELNSMAGQLENLIQARGELATLETRNRFARDLHDSVKQQVFATSLQIATARSLLDRDKEATEEHLVQAGELVRQAQKELNVLIHEMRPAALEGKGLAKALREYAAKWSEGSEIPSDIHVRGEREVPLETEQTVFRVAQEALANVAKHSGAQNAELDLAYTPKTLTLRVADDGRGFDPTQNPGEGFGLQSMRERAVKRGGHINVESAPDKGTRVTCTVPLDSASSEKGEKPWANR